MHNFVFVSGRSQMGGWVGRGRVWQGWAVSSVCERSRATNWVFEATLLA